MEAQESFTRYVILLNRVPSSETSPATIQRHVAHLRELERNGQLVLCGPFSDFAGGMVIVKAADLAEANRIAQRDPFVLEGVRSCEVRTWQLSCEANNHLGRG